MLETHWEQGEKTKKISPTPPLTGKNNTLHECMLSLPIGYKKFYFQNCLSPFLAWGNCMGRILGT